MSGANVSGEMILRTLGLPVCATLEYYWENMHFLPTEIIPHRFLENDYGMQEALTRLQKRTGLVRKTKRGWKLELPVYEAVIGMTAEIEKHLYRSELIRQTIIGALEKFGIVSTAKLNDGFRRMNMPEEVWQAAYHDLFDADFYEVCDEDTDTVYLVHPALEDAGDLLAVRMANGLIADIGNPALLRCACDYLPDNADIYFPALEWLSRCGVTPEDSSVLLQNAFYALQNSGSAEELKAEIAGAMETEELPADVEKLLDKLALEVPLWAWDGVSACEVDKMKNPDMSGRSPF